MRNTENRAPTLVQQDFVRRASPKGSDDPFLDRRTSAGQGFPSLHLTARDSLRRLSVDKYIRLPRTAQLATSQHLDQLVRPHPFRRQRGSHRLVHRFSLASAPHHQHISMGHEEAGSIAAAAVFLVGYSVWFTILTTLFVSKRIKWKSRYLLVYIHVILRLVGESYMSTAC